MNRVYFILGILLCNAITACTHVTVKRVQKETEAGIRYYLPQPFLIVTPQEDGSLDVRVESIADRQEAYAVSATSYLANHKLVVKLNQGLLTEVSLTENSAAVAAEAVKAGGEIQKSRIEADIAAATKATERQEAAAKEQRAEIKKLQDSLAQAEIERAIAEAAQKALSADASAKEKQDAAIAVARAQAKVKILRDQLSSEGVSFQAFSTIDRTNLPAAPKSGFTETTRPGPVVLRIDEDPKSGVLQLVPVNFEPGNWQKSFDAYQGVKKSSGENKKVAKAIEFEKADLGEVQLSAVKNTVRLQTKTDLKSLQVGKMVGSQSSVPNTRWPETKYINSKTFDLIFKSDTPADKYTLEFSGFETGASNNIAGSLQVTIRP